ncbi:LacI family DNA-binding transcriptional regulator [Noviherbaspirillum cavernae]|uniref:LacI family DNA-binding transcriptional regulator n=1 Tax=Noviherbaspirillum cavernae TaxID=2320862 RepID=UPI001F5B9179|nr:LacI family DNA-binding transcriptional regulator [Noviherbaspirillum cavernae]
MNDVASHAGVDVSTASRVLRGDQKQRVGEETRLRILEAAKRLDYQPNITARSLRVAKTFSLGIAVPQLDNPVFSQMIIGAERGARERGYSLLIAHIEEGFPDDDAYERLASANRVDGLLITTLDDNSVVLRAARKARVPVVLLNRAMQGIDNSIYFDSSEAARIAVRHLIDLGHTRIAHLSGQLNPSTGIGRFAGYRDALAEAGIPFDPGLVAVSGYTIKGGAEAMRTVLRQAGTSPTAVFAITLAAAAGAIMAIQQYGIRVPEDLSVVTVHDGPIAEAMFPPLTTVQMPVEQMGYDGAIGLIDLIEGRKTQINSMLHPLQLVVRGSTAAPGQPHDVA